MNWRSFAMGAITALWAVILFRMVREQKIEIRGKVYSRGDSPSVYWASVIICTVMVISSLLASLLPDELVP